MTKNSLIYGKCDINSMPLIELVYQMKMILYTFDIYIYIYIYIHQKDSNYIKLE